jgi:hypothetical protein
METGSQVELPPEVTVPFEVFVNGIPQHPGVDFDQVGRLLVFRRELAREGQLGFWRWASMLFGVAGTYRKHDTVDVVFGAAGARRVISLEPVVATGD